MLSVAIIARDEERHLAGALESVRGLAGEILVLLDDRTRDRSAEIARAHGARVVAAPWRGFPAQRNRALELCAGDWVLFLDADERVSDELRQEVQEVISEQWTADESRIEDRGSRMASRSSILDLRSSETTGYWIPRHNQFFGKTLRGGGWYPDHQLRLLRRGRTLYDEARLVHELVRLDGPAGELRGHLLHLNIEHLGELWRKQTSYALQEAQTLYLAGARARWRNLVGAPLREFQRRYVKLGGYRDGALGLFLCAALAYFELVKYAHLKGLENVKHKT
jgi:glycosyltransferase involved in cell wall biosynthesis